MSNQPELPPWWSDGLRFACTGCGRCCTGGSGYVWVSVDEIHLLAEALGMDVQAFGVRYLRRVFDRYALVDGPGGDCVFLQGRSCAVYGQRPAQCRAFPWWPATLRSPRAWSEAARECEGIHDGAPVVPAGQIAEELALARAAGLTAGFAGDDEDEPR